MCPAWLTALGLFVLCILCVVMTLGCSSRRASGDVQMAPAKNNGPSPSNDRRSLLIWTKGRFGETTTFRVNDDGEVLDRYEGVRLFARGAEWTWSASTMEVPTRSCTLLTGVTAPARQGSATRASLVRTGGTWAEELIVAPDTSCERGLGCANEVRHEVALAGSVGSLLFLVEKEWVDSCGAHGLATNTFATWDAERAVQTDLLGGLPDREAVLAAGRSKLASNEAAVVALFPVVRGERVLFEALVTAPACYACGDGEWGSYTQSTRIEVAPPRSLGDRTVMPRGVVAFRRRQTDAPGAVISGWSGVESSVTGLP